MKSIICFYQHVLIIFENILQVAQLFLHLPLVDKTDIPALFHAIEIHTIDWLIGWLGYVCLIPPK